MMSFLRSSPTRDAAEIAYGRVVEQSRQAEFFLYLAVPDTLDGRFESICLHAFLYLNRLKQEPESAAALGQAFFDAMFADFDRSLREIGTGDLSVGRHISHMAQSFYGRVRAYEQGLEGSDTLLKAALVRNLYGTTRPPAGALRAMAGYVRREASALRGQRSDALIAGQVMFGKPPDAAATNERGDAPSLTAGQ